VWAGISIAAMISVALLLLLLSINIDRFGPSADQSAALARLRNIVLAQEKFRSEHGCFAGELSQLPNVASQDRNYSYAIETKGWGESGVRPNTSSQPPPFPGSEDKGRATFQLTRLKPFASNGHAQPIKIVRFLNEVSL